MSKTNLKVYALQAAAFLVVAFVIYLFIFVFTPFFLGAVLAVVIERPVSALSKKIPRSIASLFMLLVVVAVLLLLMSLVVTNIIQELVFLMQDLPQHREQIGEYAEEFLQKQDELLEIIPTMMVGVIESNLDSLYRRGENLLSEIINELLNLTLNIPSMIIFILFTVIAGFFTSKDKDIVKKYIGNKINTTDETQANILKDMLSYIKVQLSIMSIVMLLTGILFVSLGIPYAILLAVLSGVLDIIPVIGPGGVLWPMMAYFVFFRPVLAVPVFLTYLAAISVRPIFESRILGGNIGVHPLILLLGIYTGMITLGLKGIILAPLSIIVFKALSKAGCLPAA